MSHESSPHAPSVDTDRPYLMPRSGGDVDVAHVLTDERGQAVLNSEGWVTLVSQKDGGRKEAHPMALEDDVQGQMAHELGASRPSLTPEQMERYSETSVEMAGVALAEVGIESPEVEESETSESSELAEMLASPDWRSVGDLAGQLRSRTDMIAAQLDQFDGLLSRLQYEGGRVDGGASQLADALDSLRRIVLSHNTAEDLASRSRVLQARTQEVYDTLKRDEASSEDDRYSARKVEEIADELGMASRVITSEYDELRTMLQPYGRFESSVEELIRTTQGSEMTIAMLKAQIREATDSTLGIRSRLARVQGSLDDVSRLRTI